jgi:hypothetical protein
MDVKGFFHGGFLCRSGTVPPETENKKAAGGISACGFGLIYGNKIKTAQADAYNNTRNKNMLCLRC